MATNEILHYEQGLVETIGNDSDPLFYLFDYDVRSFDINMEFQHFHRFYEIHILIDKDAEHLVDGALFPLRQYDITLLPPLKLHKSIYPEGSPVRRLIIDFSIPEEANPLLNEETNRLLSVFYADPPVLRFNESEQKEIFFHINEICDLLKHKAPGYMLQVHTEFIRFLYCLNKYAPKNIYKQVKENTLEEKIYQVTSYIHAHFAEELSLEFLSQTFYISPYYLSHQFKAITGFNLVNYIQMTRIRNAQQMLLSGKAKITDISIACGFNSFSQFNRTFNKLVGKSPSDFKKNAIQAL
ncbi:MAG: AraC family transcriptional regulator [Lachnospiraceae bacterium]|nr:AraC family transcriptional regulator [Lachnospiraceae bacterium]